MESDVAFLKRLKADVEGLLQNMVEGRYRIFEVLSPGQTFFAVMHLQSTGRK
jgi:hypothetical protein